MYVLQANSDIHEAADKFDDVKIFGSPNKCLTPLENEVCRLLEIF